MRVLALDFDGVISDSAPECFWVAARTLERVRPGSLGRARLDRWDALSGPEARDAIRRDPFYEGFLAIMPLGNRAEDFGVALLALEAGRRLPDQAAYDRYYAAQDPGFAADFHGHFYGERVALRDAAPEKWGQLMSPYGELIDVLRRRKGECEVVIATAKDADSVGRLISRFGVEDLFGPGCVYDKERGRDKRAHISAVSADFAVAFEDITFIDDKANHLVSVAALGPRCLLAAWGYNSPREYEQVRANGIGVCELEELEAAVFG
ncbi:MAG: hypothetical protein GY733_14795 [bacterium]|nr:hypothetical protein [bacterium]